ncbi:MAG TPA: alkyl sulfatase dimerization domain-containing protein [Candidatus Limnocylindrales bacterium]|nr:alkyl sulfatase dimerization domain-containing protein [Candidatus Limnocylindrales bacterium]
MTDPAATASEPVRQAHGEALATLPFDDTQDFEDANRGFVGRLEPLTVHTDDGRVAWDLEAYRFLREAAPATANPSLWRQSQLNTIDGLFEVVPGIYQARGFDLSNITFVEGDTGVLVIDPLVSNEPAAAALALYRKHRGDRPVVGVMYSHSHADHFGGVKGVTTQEDVDAGRCAVIAPEGFLEHAVSENVYAGTAMLRRAGYMFGAALERGPAGQIGTGLGQTNSTGTVSLIAPTDTITTTGETRVLDGIRMEFQVTPGTEAPAEMNTLFPDHGALWMAENATHVLHNILTIRGAVVRDARVWARYLTEAIDLYGDRMDVVFASHHWPTWGRERVLRYLSEQRDLYTYLHDQTLRMLNQGMNGAEIAEAMELPPALARGWHARGYYGSVSHNVKAIYQRYMGWYDGNPARLWQHTPVEQGKRYVAAMGGIDAVVAHARAALEGGDLRWAAELLDRAIFAEPEHSAARELQAATLEQLAYGAENGPWRNAFLAGATELRKGSFGTPVTFSPDLMRALTPAQVFDAIAIRVNGPRAWEEVLSIGIDLTDLGRTYRLDLRNGVLVHRETAFEGVDLVLRMPAAALPGLLAGRLDGVAVEGDASALARLVAVLDDPDPGFAVITP